MEIEQACVFLKNVFVCLHVGVPPTSESRCSASVIPAPGI